jgi:hypothetical protein
VFFGKVADNNDTKIKDKFFCGEIKIDLDKMKEKRSQWQPLPQFTDFGEAQIREEVLARSHDYLLDYYCDYIRVNGTVVLEPDDLMVAASEMLANVSNQEKAEILEKVISDKIDYAVQKRIQDNFISVQNDVREIIRKECEVSQEITPHSSNKPPDPSSVDPFNVPG